MDARKRLRSAQRTASCTIPPMKAPRIAGFAIVSIAAAIGLAAPAYADPDTDFDNQIARYGIYGPHDYNPYIAKISCRRLGQGVDPDAAATTAGIALIAGIAVMMCPRSMNSSIVVASK